MDNIGIFNVLGPIMIGPSSSHTAGAARLGKIAKIIAADKIEQVTFWLHGSFAKTYKGHGTDKALVAGILGMEPSDIRLRNALDIAKKSGIEVKFKEINIPEAHPNTVKFEIKCIEGKKCEVIGTSIGGGNIEINEINGNKVNFTGEYPTLITCHQDIPGTVAKITNILYDKSVNIAFMKLIRSQKGKAATLTFEVDSSITEEMVMKIKEISGINKVVVINPLREEE